MSGEIEKFFADRLEEQKKRERQVAFATLPVFSAMELIEATKPVLLVCENNVNPEKYIPATRTTISQLETIYPWILEKEGLLDRPLPVNEAGNGLNKDLIIGEKLHSADLLFSLIVQGVRGADELRKVLPTLSQQEIEKYDMAVNDIGADKLGGEADIVDRMLHAWGKYHRLKDNSFYATNLTLAGFGVPDPKEVEEIYYGDEVDKLGMGLAKAWAREAVKNKPMSWEFVQGAFSQREVQIGVKFIVPNLQFIGRLDSITRLLRGNKKELVKSQIVDFKTGRNSRDYTGLEGEIKKRQEQVMQVMVERFTGKFLKGFNLEAERKIFAFTTHHESRASVKRLDKAGYRWFDKQTGMMEFKEFRMTDEERKDFNLWLIWYGQAVGKHKEEIHKILRRKIRYDLRGL